MRASVRSSLVDQLPRLGWLDGIGKPANGDNVNETSLQMLDYLLHKLKARAGRRLCLQPLVWD